MFPAELWRYPRFNPYHLIRPLLFRLDAEKAHRLALKMLERGLGPKEGDVDDPILQTSVSNLILRNPIGLAAGFDKNAEVIRDVLYMGFGLVEIGTITPRPQVGNPQPRLFRVLESEAIINRLGFNSDGMDMCLRRIKAWHDSTRLTIVQKRGKSLRGLIGFNVGINKDSVNPTADFALGVTTLAPYADYLTINISSPNTPGLRDLQNREQLIELVNQVMEARNKLTVKPPVFVKIAPDLTDAQEEDVAQVVLQAQVEGLIIGNTTISRPSSLPAGIAKEAGGLSGKPLFELSTKVLAHMYKLTQGKVALIGCGGVMSGADAYDKIRMGASLVQIYSGLIFKGPSMVIAVKKDLAALLRRDGFKSVSEAVGSGIK